ncbi:catalase/peroxidase HPI, partial [Escherichia coli 8.2524]
DRFDLL